MKYIIKDTIKAILITFAGLFAIVIAIIFAGILFIFLYHEPSRNIPTQSSLKDMQTSIGNECSNASDIYLFGETERYKFSVGYIYTTTTNDMTICTGYEIDYEADRELKQNIHDRNLYSNIYLTCEAEKSKDVYYTFYTATSINDIPVDIYFRDDTEIALKMRFEFCNMFYCIKVCPRDSLKDESVVKIFIAEIQPIISNMYKVI